MHSLVFTRRAMKSLQRAPRETAAAVRGRLERLADGPFDQNADVTKLRHRPGYRLRVGEWRVIYEIQKAQVIVMVLKIAPRGEVYE